MSYTVMVYVKINRINPKRMAHLVVHVLELKREGGKEKEEGRVGDTNIQREREK
jgi:hypothetical protein